MWLKKGEVPIQVAQKFALSWDKRRKQWFADDSNLGIRDWLAGQQYREKAPRAALPGWNGSGELIPLSVPRKDEAAARTLGAEKVGGRWAVRKGLGIGRFQRWLP
ncbi:hypothetical protein [Paraburkholderia bannensis]|uniref:hypothetical protein n=1 Tax=Paraburkholderia bannensis TaxID=765414 RepID=UPI00048636EF|nr:hypothetical protein [Paraburkholderia bannensis]